MARATITPTSEPGPYTYTGQVLAFVAADAVNFNQAVFDENLLLLARNTGVGARTVDVTSAPDAKGRTKDIVGFSIPAGSSAIFGPFKRDGWLQADGFLYFQGSHAEVLFAVLKRAV